MKKLNLIALAVLFASSAAYAVDVTNNFNVSVNFTGACQVLTPATDMAFTYAAFGVADTKSTSTVFKCSRGLAPTFKFDNTGAAQTGSAAGAVGAAITGEGVISGIRYTLSGSSAKSTTGTAAAAGAGGTGGSDGTADQYTVSINADIAGDQAGNGASGSGTHVRVLTISY
ncbi:hypothetical protein [Ramlibacter sp. AN1133]|uniref:hypothetical protein n=1 Tax=Ramlibacter sp. AN1133 TaxID=3133429 RepID=UPI0030BB4357